MPKETPKRYKETLFKLRKELKAFLQEAKDKNEFFFVDTSSPASSNYEVKESIQYFELREEKRRFMLKYLIEEKQRRIILKGPSLLDIGVGTPQQWNWILKLNKWLQKFVDDNLHFDEELMHNTLLQILQEIPGKYFGYLEKRGQLNRSWKKRWVVLTKTDLEYYKSREAYQEKKGQRGSIPLKDYNVKEESRLEFLLQKKDGDKDARIYYFRAQDTISQKEWIDKLKETAANVEIVLKEQELNDCLIPEENIEYDKSQLVEAGAQGRIIRGKWSGIDVAIKIPNSDPDFIDSVEETRFLQEILVLSKLHHPNIVRMFGYSRKNDMLLLVTKFVEGGDLSKLIHQETPISLKTQINIAEKVARGMNEIHSKGIVHRDLKPQNILVSSETDEVLICDLGIAALKRDYDPESTSLVAEGTPIYAPPEFNNTKKITSKFDVWSYGIILYEIYTRENIWETGNDFKEKIPSISISCPFREIIERCVAHNPEKRPTFSEIIQMIGEIKIKYQNILTNISDQIIEEVEKKKTSSIPWTEFESIIRKVYPKDRKIKHLSSLEFLFDPLCEKQKAQVEISRLKELLKWFNPIIESDDYENKAIGNTVGYSIEEVIDLSSQPWFVGFVSKDLAKEYLEQKEEGTYLFRFSSTNPGEYALSVTSKNGVAHWRILQKKEARNMTMFSLDNHQFRSLNEIIEKFTTEPLQTRAGNVFLTKPIEKQNFLEFFVQNSSKNSYMS